MSENPSSEAYFLSYSRADQDFALRLAGDLRANGVNVWVDQLDIRPSEHWDRAIERAVRDCRGLVVIVSPRSAASDNVADEISFAIDHGKSVLPVMIERCPLPLRIARMQVIDVTGDYDRALRQCLAALVDGHLPSRSAEAAAAPEGIQDREAIVSAKAELTAFLGPIASILVEKEAARSSSVSDLYRHLAEHIPNERDRERFTALAPKVCNAPAPTTGAAGSKTEPSLGEPEVDRVASILIHYLGPIATVIARRESAGAASAEDLQQRLASRIPDERERADFLSRLRKP